MDNTWGTIIKQISGFYYVKTEKQSYLCKARGLFRKDQIVPFVGDRVEIQIIDEKEAYIVAIQNRKNEIFRPKVANVDQAIVVFASEEPKIHFHLLDKMLILCENKGIEIVLCINKMDLNEKAEAVIQQIYGPSSYQLLFVSAKEEKNIEELKQRIVNKISFLAGPSGVGKTSLLNSLNLDFHFETGGLSKKIKRGKHTTRHSELIEVFTNSFIIDTPGFSNLDFLQIDIKNLDELFPEFRPFLGKCKYSSCKHVLEPGCAVLSAVPKHIHPSRYENYKDFLKELSN